MKKLVLQYKITRHQPPAAMNAINGFDDGNQGISWGDTIYYYSDI
jgi:hypothetical protein